MRRRFSFVIALAVAVTVFTASTTVCAAAGSTLLKEGMEGSAVIALQKDLSKLGFFDNEITGFYGELTADAVKRMQKKYGETPDGAVGSETRALIDRLRGKSGSSASTSKSSAAASVLKKGVEGSAVTKLQNDLKKLGFLNAAATGLYGDLTVAAVKKLQKKHGLTQDGAAGQSTLALLDKLTGRTKTVSTAAKTTATSQKTATTSSKASTATNYLLPWFTSVSKTFKVGATATVYDINTGLSFKVKRTYGTNHADCEPLTANDTKIMKKVYGGAWSWSRRAVVVTVGDKKIAASMAGMPHAGSESAAANRYISSRSGGYGRGTNLDAVKGNNMSGHFDLHFQGSKTHGTNKVDKAHQAMVKKAADWAKKNLK